MNLEELRQRIKTYSDFRPSNDEYNRELDDILNDAYRRVWSHKRWSFCTKDEWLQIYPILNFARTGARWSATDGEREVNFIGASVHVMNWRRDLYEGNIIELAGREYTILKVVSATQLIVDEPIRFTTGYTIGLLGNEDWSIKVRFYRLPIDCAEVLTIAQRDAPIGSGAKGRNTPPYGKVKQLAARRDAEWGLLQDYASAYAEFYVPVSPTIVDSAYKVDVEVIETQQPAPIGALTSNNYYEICWAFVSPDGFVGSLSQPKTVQIGTQSSGMVPVSFTLNVKFLTYDDKPVKADLSSYATGPYKKRRFEGLKKRLFYNANFNPATGERLGKPCWQEIRNGGATESVETAFADDPLEALDTDDDVAIAFQRSFAPGTAKWNWEGRTYHRIRPYPLIDTWDIEYPFVSMPDENNPASLPKNEDYFRRLQLIYYRRIEPLILPTDVPEMPLEFHDVIFRVAMSAVLYKNGDNVRAVAYERDANNALKEFAKRYLIQVDNDWRLGRFGVTDTYRSMYDTSSLRKI